MWQSNSSNDGRELISYIIEILHDLCLPVLSGSRDGKIYLNEINLPSLLQFIKFEKKNNTKLCK